MKLIENIKAKTPSIWRKVTVICVSIKVSAGLFLATDYIKPMPPDLVTYSYYVLAACFVIAGFSESQAEKK